MAQPSRMSRRDIWIHLLLYPGHTLPTAAAPVIVGVGLAVHDHVFAALPALLGFLASWLIHVGGVFTDNYELLVRHPRTREHPELTDALADGTLTLARLRWTILTCFALPALAAPYLLQVGGLPVLLLAVIGIAASWMYAGGPFPFAKLGLPTIGRQSPASIAEGMPHTLYQWLIAPIVAFVGFAFLARRHMARSQADEKPKS